MLLTIITINYNDLEGLKKTMTSVLEQTYDNIEYIVIDGSSTDGSKEYIEAHIDHLAYWVSEPDSGIYNAMNKGVAKANGDFLLFLNSGDWLIDNKILEKIDQRVFINDIVSGNIRVVGNELNFVKKVPEKISFSYLYKDTLPHQSTFIRKDLFSKIGYYDENNLIAADWKFFIQAICKYNATYGKLDKVISFYNLNGLSAKKENIFKIKQERVALLEKEFGCYIESVERLQELNNKVRNLRKSKWINLLIRFKLIHKF